MTINKTKNGDAMTVALEGRLDTTTAPELDADMKGSLEGVKELIFDFANLEYISSAGLRVILANQKAMSKQGSMKVVNVSAEIMEIFSVTGFSDILTIE
ncbi:MAG: STAS domain-containing protein [Lachnospiraceae bacterium]|nr:STAS domain-containing protein [Lachnospiraceae bacterium]